MTETQEIELSFTREEFDFIYNTLKARRIYEPYAEKWNYQIWQPFMKDLLDKIEVVATGLGNNDV